MLQSGLIPKAKQTKWTGDTETCLYDISETNVDKAMQESRKRIVQFLNGCYEIAEDKMSDETKETFLFSNRATYPFITLAGLLHSFLFHCGEINATSTIKERIAKITPYIQVLCDGLNNLPEEEAFFLKGAQGQGAEKKWLLSYQNIINKSFPSYFPEELKEWKEMRDQDLQQEGENLKEEIRSFLRKLFFVRLYDVYGSDYEKNIGRLKHDCEGKIYEAYGDNDGFSIEDYDWKDWIEITDYKNIIEKNFSYKEFSEVFGIPLSEKATSKKERLSWLSLIELQKGKKKNALTKSDVNRLWLIHDHLANFLSNEE